MRTIDKIITKVSTTYGAPMGRQNINTTGFVEYSLKGKLFDCAVPMSDSCYDKGGAYWGTGKQLRVEYNKALTWIRFYRVGDPR